MYALKNKTCWVYVDNDKDEKISRKKVVASMLQVCWLRQELKVWQSLSVSDKLHFSRDLWVDYSWTNSRYTESRVGGQCPQQGVSLLAFFVLMNNEFQQWRLNVVWLGIWGRKYVSRFHFEGLSIKVFWYFICSCHEAPVQQPDLLLWA